MKVTDNAMTVLKDRRYLQVGPDGSTVETPEDMIKRVAKKVASVEPTDKLKKEWEEKFFKLMDDLDFLPNSPALMNLGTKNVQHASACHVLAVEDTRESIFGTLTKAAIIFSNGGGVGYNFGKLRPRGSMLKRSGGTASGPLSFMKLYDSLAECVKGGGRRRAAQMICMNVSHPDIEEFVSCKDVEGKMTNFNISVLISDQFMEAVDSDSDFWLVNPHTGKRHKKIKARPLFEKICKQAWKNGEPGVLFHDTINQFNTLIDVGEIDATNPCCSADTFLHTDRGMYRIGYLSTLNNNQNCVVDNRTIGTDIGTSIRPASGAFKTADSAKLYRVITEAGYSIKVTDYHELYTDRGKLKLKDIVVGDKLWISSGSGGFGNHGDRETGFLLGFWYGDGAFHNEEDGSRVAITLYGEKRELAGRIMDAATALANTVPLADNCPRDSYELSWCQSDDRLVLRSYRLTKAFETMGVTSKKVSDWIFSASKECVAGFLEGYFAADGTVNISGKSGSCALKYGSVNLELLEDTQLLLSNFGIFSRLYQNRKKACRKLMPDGKGGMKEYECQAYHELYVLDSTRKILAGEIGLGRSKHINRFAEWTPSKEKTPTWVSTIKEIEYIGEEPVYCITQPDHNSVVFNGIVSGQCGEVPLLPNESCVLGSINVSHFTRDRGIDFDRLAEAVKTGIRFLDDMIDAAEYTFPEIEEATKYGRKIGLGVMGFADLLTRIKVSYNSEDGIKVAESLAKFIDDTAFEYSQQLGEEKGNFPAFDRSTYKKLSYLRNAQRTVIAPTGTLSMIANCSGGIEPLFQLAYVKRVMGDIDDKNKKELVYANEEFERATKEIGVYSARLMEKVLDAGNLAEIDGLPSWIKEVFVTATEIPHYQHVRMQAAWQRHVGGATSKTINAQNETTVQDVYDIFVQAWRSKCKGITIYRTGSRQEEVLIGPRKKEGEKNPVRTDEKVGVTRKLHTSRCGNLLVIMNYDEQGNLVEVIPTLGKTGNCNKCFLEALGRLASVGLEKKLTPEELVKQLSGINCPYPTTKMDTKGEVHFQSCPDAIAVAIADRMGSTVHEITADGRKHDQGRSKCPKCGTLMEVVGGCEQCPQCGHGGGCG